jgi:HK97 family phage prohead protease
MASGQRKNPARHRALASLPEVRYVSAPHVEVRQKSNTDEIVLEGVAIVYSTPYSVVDSLGEFKETMAPGCASAVLARGADIRYLVNHTGLPLARTTARTLTLRDTPSGLEFTARLDARSQMANDLYVAVSRGDVSACSIGFVVGRDTWDKSRTPERRTIHELAELMDISSVTYPASPTTSVKVAQRMALEVPVESRARLRRIVADVAAGRSLSRDELSALRSVVSDQDGSPRNRTQSVSLREEMASRGMGTADRTRRMTSTDLRRKLAAQRRRLPTL